MSTDDEAINLLSFDGGGVRGVTSLLIIHEIMIKIKERHGLAEIPKPCDVFHMIAGTSTGGLIAIMLGRLRMSTEEALRQYDVCAENIFSSKKWANITEKFRSTPMINIIQKLVAEKDMGEMMRDPAKPAKGKAVVCAMPRKRANPKNVRRIRSFSPEKDNWDKYVKIWEAARATTAATFYFKPQPLTVSTPQGGSKIEDYIDAAFGVNNPTNELIKEAVAEFGPSRRLGCLISIGTGTKQERVISRAASGLRNVCDMWGSIFDVGMAMKDMVTNAELVHFDLEMRLRRTPDAYFRFNVPLAADEVSLAQYGKIGKLKSMTAKYLCEPEVVGNIERAADILETENAEHHLNLGALSEPSETRPDENLKANLMGEASRYFTGRNHIMGILNTFFSDREDETVPRREFCLHGLGGVGKTQIALKAANIFRHGDPELGIPRKRRFPHILYVDGTDKTTISQSYASIARDEFGIEASGNSDQLMRQALQKMERLDEDWFLIYDNCNQEDRRELLPKGDTGNVLFTTRNRVVRNQMRDECVYDVEVLEELDAIRLLLTASGSKYADLNAWDQSIGKEIVEELGYLPLAIDQAAAYIREAPCPLDGYLEVFRKQRVELLRNPKFKGSLAQNQAVYTTFEASYKAIAQLELHNKNTLGRNAGLALRALDLVCFWHNENIPVKVAWWGGVSWKNRLDMGKDMPALEEHLAQLTGDETMTWRKFFFQLSESRDGEFPSALDILERYSILTVKERELASMHVLVHSWARDRMKAEHRARQALVSKVLLLDSIGDTLTATYARSYLHSIYPHVRACLEHSTWGSRSLYLPYELVLRGKYAHILTFQKRFGEAEAEYLDIIHLSKLSIGPTTWAVQRPLCSLGKLYHEMGRLREAELTYLECIDRCILEKEANRMEIEGRVKAQLAQLRAVPRRKKQNKNDESDEDRPPSPQLSEEGIAQAARWFVPDWNSTDSWQLQISNIEENLARVYYDQANAEDDLIYSADLLASALHRRKKILHPENMELWRTEDEYRSRTQHRDVKYWLFRFEAAMKTFKSEEDQVAFITGEYHGRLVQNMANSMVAMRQCVKYHKGEDYWAEDLKWMWEQAHKYYGTILWNGFIKWFGESDYRCLEVMRRMVKCLIGLKRYEEAEALARRCLASSIVGYGECHQQTILSLEKLHEAIACRLGGYDLESVYVIKEAFHRADAVFGVDHRLTKRTGRKTTRAMENYQENLSDWAPMSQNILTDAHWEYGAMEDQETREVLLGERAKHHLVSYTIPDPNFDARLRKMAEANAKAVLEETMMEVESEAAPTTTTTTTHTHSRHVDITPAPTSEPPSQSTSKSLGHHHNHESFGDSQASTLFSQAREEQYTSDSSSGDRKRSDVNDIKGKSVAE
ncbi:Patatin-like phospholipase-1 [Podospora pseudopauciseta]|uniref:Patatin-like phospholipase-1 n=1 Tax=Podospora pseudopauciseta TaxID=2093780 RepID=A0ABR0HZT3_9PEZI|nr:Patatin-like phospholipase-1 [Podospora pseudopauciseta]